MKSPFQAKKANMMVLIFVFLNPQPNTNLSC